MSLSIVFIVTGYNNCLFVCLYSSVKKFIYSYMITWNDNNTGAQVIQYKVKVISELLCIRPSYVNLECFNSEDIDFMMQFIQV